jgi:RNA 3'-terminal phosphate cyclase
MHDLSFTYKGSNHLKQKLILATLAGKSIKIVDIRAYEGGGIKEFEGAK